jgi:hypothetical protein
VGQAGTADLVIRPLAGFIRAIKKFSNNKTQITNKSQ